MVARLLLFVPIILILLATLYESSEATAVGHQNHRRTMSSSGGDSNRSLLGIRRNNQMLVDCSEMASQSHCSLKPNKCRWCRSEVLDDMCFSKSEAWRLPPQVFSCG